MDLGINEFSDLTQPEKKSLLLGSIVLLKNETDSDDNDDDYSSNESGELDQIQVQSITSENNGVATALLTPVDWRGRAVSSVKYQGACGSCYAFSAAAAVESTLMRKGRGEIDVSEQEIIDCTYGKYYANTFNSGCGGGDTATTMRYALENGVAQENQYPYVSGFTKVQGSCRATSGRTLLSGMTLYTVGSRDENLLANALTKSPISVTINSDNSEFYNYKGGIYSNPQCSTYINHAVQLVGMGILNGDKNYNVNILTKDFNFYRKCLVKLDLERIRGPIDQTLSIFSKFPHLEVLKIRSIKPGQSFPNLEKAEMILEFGSIPDSVTKLTLSHILFRYNPQKIPSTVKNLSILGWIYPPETCPKHNVIPYGVEKLYIKQEADPFSIKRIKLSADCNISIPSSIAPPFLEELELNSLTTVDTNFFFIPTLTRINAYYFFDSMYLNPYQYLDAPPLQHLNCRFMEKVSVGSIPSTVKSLGLLSSDSVMFQKDSIPHQLEKLSVPFLFLKENNLAMFPPSLKILELFDDYTIYTFDELTPLFLELTKSFILPMNVENILLVIPFLFFHKLDPLFKQINKSIVKFIHKLLISKDGFLKITFNHLNLLSFGLNDPYFYFVDTTAQYEGFLQRDSTHILKDLENLIK
eukprot:gene8447-10376_t